MNCEYALIKSWYVNGFEVKLLGNENYLTYETLDTTTNEVIDKGSFEEDQKMLKKTPKEMSVCLEKCRVMLNENNEILFSQSIAEWGLEDKHVYLIEGKRDFVWEIFSNITKTSTFFSFIKSTIPSSRCHHGTIALIEKIKEECQNDIRRADILMEDFKVVRVLDKQTHNRELLKLSERVSEIEQYSPVPDLTLTLVSAGIGGSTALAASFKSICAITSSVSSFFGSGIIGNLAGAYTALTAAPIAFGLGVSIPFGGALAYVIVKENKRNEERKLLIDTISYRNLQAPFLIEIEPKITASSEFDKRVLVSKFTWAVTLVSHGGQPKTPYPFESGYGNHAEIYVEGINDGFYNEQSPLIKEAKPVLIGEKFIHLSHYQPKIESGLRSKDNLEYETRSETWMVTCEKVKMMLQNIENEKVLPEDQLINYNMAGIDEFASKFVGREKGHNCFTWARYHLKSIGIDLKLKEFPPSAVGFAAALVTDYTKIPEKYTETPIQRI